MAAGRPRAFDTDQALDRAMQVFWRKGYEGASLTDLTRAMGINPPSLYAAFGNKAELFRAVVERYSIGPGAHGPQVLALPTARAVTQALLEGAADVQTAPGNPGGCLLVQGALACGDEAQPLRQELAARRAANVEMFRARLERAQAEGDLPADADPAGLAQYIATVIHGMAVQAAGGARRAELQKVIDIAMKAWPS